MLHRQYYTRYAMMKQQGSESCCEHTRNVDGVCLPWNMCQFPHLNILRLGLSLSRVDGVGVGWLGRDCLGL